jgi:hypothetical protein
MRIVSYTTLQDDSNNTYRDLFVFRNNLLILVLISWGLENMNIMMGDVR